MKKTVFCVMILTLLIFCFVSCHKSQVILNDTEKVPTEDEVVVNDEPGNVSPPNIQIENQPSITPSVVSHPATANNNLNGAMVIFADDYVIYDLFVENPMDQLTGGEHHLYRANTDFSNPQLLYTPYFPAKSMCIYDDKLYFLSGVGGYHLYQLDLKTNQVTDLNNNFKQDEWHSIGFLELNNDWLYFDYNSSLCRMKPDQSEFEVIYKFENPMDSPIFLAENYILFKSHDNSIYKLDIESQQKTLFLENFQDGFINYYDRRIYYTQNNKLISSDLDGIERRNLFELEQNQYFNAINVDDGYIYYVVVNSLDQDTYTTGYQSLHQYNLNGGENRHLSVGLAYNQLTCANHNLYFYFLHQDLPDMPLYQLNPITLKTTQIS